MARRRILSGPVRRTPHGRTVIPAAAVNVYLKCRVRTMLGTMVYRVVPYGNRRLDNESVGYAMQDRFLNEMMTGVRH